MRTHLRGPTERTPWRNPIDRSPPRILAESQSNVGYHCRGGLMAESDLVRGRLCCTKRVLDLFHLVPIHQPPCWDENTNREQCPRDQEIL